MSLYASSSSFAWSDNSFWPFNFCSKFDTVPCNLQPAFTTSGVPQGSYFLPESDSQGFIFFREFSGAFNSIGMKCYSRIIFSVNYRAGSMIWVLRGPSRAPKAQGWRRRRRREYMGVPLPRNYFHLWISKCAFWCVLRPV